MKKEINFKAETPYEPAGDQPTAIKELSESILKGNRYQTLEGVTDSGKTLAAQLYSEFRSFFPDAHVA